ncbi:BMP family ABC transporter substrate-binding protein [Herbiconiux moechotypicola]|uniref:BMP family ABC transporter substrate-binding protein n=1 Tax=Herbiconiux moechotypicola TaxID=637393 RepID=A0ABP5QCL8_9MICO|nr:BMP family ABC transporter substrate-binding protein [Herbiconiux moechotypicola]MCS5729719.1 BMP family ABC transporter substrate-binding protein [Herbiconiux moechotypicola]
MTRRFALAGAAAAALALALAGCAAPPTASDTTSTATASDYCARMVTNSGGLDDRSFNQSSWEGLERAQEEFGIDAQVLVSTGETDLAPNVTQAVQSGCAFVLTVGYELADATAAEAEANPGTHFAIVDESVEAPNVKPILFDTAQASYLAGYLAAGVSTTGKVATFGGGNQPPVTLFMDGFVDGVAKYNEVHGTQVQALGWDKAAQDGVFTGDFEDINKGKTVTQGFIDQGADVILPVAGQVGEGAAAAALEAGGVSLIWVDNDGYDTLPAEYRPIVLTSVMKNTGDAVVEIVGDDLDGSFSPEPFVGTLENGGVALAPFHDLEASVTPELAAEITELQAQIAAGSITVESPSTP